MSLSSGPPTIPNTFFFELLPKIALAGLAVVVAVVVWSIWRSVSPAAPGVSMGYLEILGRYGGGKMLKSIRGTLVDSTPLFLNPRVERLFRQMLIEDITNKLKLVSAGKQTKPEANSTSDGSSKDSTPSEGTEVSMTTAPEDQTKEEAEGGLEDALAEFKNEGEPLSKLCRIIITRKHFFGKDVIVQWGHVGPLSEYAAVDPESKFTFGMGFLTQGIVTGELETFSEQWTIDKLGDCTVYLFKPDVYKFDGKQEIVTPPAYLAKIALHASSYVEAEEQLSSKDDQITQLKRENARMGLELSGKATEVDGLYTATKGFTTEGGGALPQLAPRRFGLNEFVFLFAPTVIGYIVARYWNFEPFYGVFVGLAVGAYLVSRRMG